MSRFIQLHVLTSYPPSNLNRDDLGRPKSAVVGGVARLRVSSQALKRAWRTSDVFRSMFGDLGERNLGRRTKRMGLEWLYPSLIEAGISADEATNWSRNLQAVYGEPEAKDKALLNSQLMFLDPLEEQRLKSFTGELIEHLKGKATTENVARMLKAIEKRDKAKDKKQAKSTYAREMGAMLLVATSTAVDIALFGRMLAANPLFNVEAATQVAHAITVHKATIEDDYFTAVDDLNRGDDDRGAGHIDETGFGAGVYYLYVCINRALLDQNLGGDIALRSRALAALLQTITQVSPTGKQNSFGSRAHASCVLGEKGDQQPRSLSAAFLRPIINRDGNTDMTADAINALQKKRLSFETMYGAGSEHWMAAAEGEFWPLFPDGKVGSLDALIAFVQAD